MVRNPVKERLAAGQLAIGVAILHARSVHIAKLMAAAGFDFLFIDLEHGAMSLDTAGQISVAALDAGIAPLVRVPGFEHHHAASALDAGALGVVIPHVDTAEVARQMVRHCRYPPEGARSIAGAPPQLGYRALPAAEATAALNAATLVVLMLETPAAIDNVEQIAAVPGVDVLHVGTNDLCLAMGIPGQLDHPSLGEAFARVAGAAQAHGVHVGMGGVYEPALMGRYIELGARFVTAGSDLGLLLAAARERTATVRGMLAS